jgi:hypothetical protein
VFLGLRLSDVDKTVELRDVVEEVLFESGKHLFLVADQKSFEQGFEHAIIAWNRSREAARSVAEALPYLRSHDGSPSSRSSMENPWKRRQNGGKNSSPI